MIANCPHCGKTSRVGGEGFFRCPHCRRIFQAQAGDLQQDPAATPITPSFVYDEEPAVPEFAEKTAPPPDAPSSPSLTTICERCGHYQATAVCRECGLMVCASCAEPAGPGQALCRAHLGEAEKLSPENRPFSLLVDLLSRPAETFARMLPDARLFGRALVFYLATGVFAVICREVYLSVLPAPYGDPAAAILSNAFPFLALESEPSAAATIASIAFSPFVLLIALFLQGLIYHVAFRLFGVGKGGLTVTLKAVAYATGASSALVALPVVGVLLSGIFSLVLTIIGAAKLHRTSYGRVIGAIVVLMLLGALIGALGMALLSGAGGAVKSGGKLI